MDLLSLLKDNIYIVLLILFLYLCFVLNSQRNLNFPPGPYNLPIVGYLPFLGKDPHEKLKELAGKYGNIFSIRLGTSSVVVLADYESMKEGLNKSATADRPPDLFHFLPGEMGLVSVNGADWVEQRRYSIKTLKDLGLGKSKFETQVQEEVRDFVHFLEKQRGRPLHVKAPLIATVSNNILNLLFGYHLPVDDARRVALNRGINGFTKAFTQTGLEVVMPKVLDALRKIGFKVGSSMKEDLVAFSDFVRAEIKFRKDNINDENKEGYVYKYLTDLNDENASLHSSYNEDSLLGNVQAYIFGGIETTMTTLHWTFLAMATHPQIQARIQREVDDVLGELEPQWPQRASLPYTYATILEIMRWRTLAPLNLTHLTNEDTKIGGYDIPKGTVLLALIYALHQDTRYWPDPEVFRPERFLGENGELVARKESWAPFSTGKRNCPGEIVAMIEVFLYFASIMQKFTIRTADPNPDLKGTLGIVLVPNDDIQLMFEARNSKGTGAKD